MADVKDLFELKIEEARKLLPKETLDAIDAVDWRAVILGMREGKGYSFEQLGALEIETELVLCGLLNPEDYTRELESRMGVTRAQASELVREMNERVFKKIREELIKNSERQKIFQKRNAEESGDNLESRKSPESRKDEARPSVLSVSSLQPSPDAEIKDEDTQILNSSGIKIITPTVNTETVEEKPLENRDDLLQKVENPSLTLKTKEETPALLKEKLLAPAKREVVETEHTLKNMERQMGETDVKTKPVGSASGYGSGGDPYRLRPEA